MGGVFRVSVSSDDLSQGGWATRTVHGVLANTDDLTIRAEHAKTIRGRVFWSDGRPANEVSVSAHPLGEDHGYCHADTDSQGGFKITGLVSGLYSLSAWISVDRDEDSEVTTEYGAEVDGIETGAADLRVVLRELPPEEDQAR